MFIRKRDYKKLLYRLEEMEKAIEQHDEQFIEIDKDMTYLGDTAIPKLRKDTEETLCGFATDIEDLQSKVKAFQEEAEAVSKDRELEKSFYDGLSNIMSYGVTYGKKQTE